MDDTTWTGPAGAGYPVLNEDTHTDVVVIGGGLTGVVSAYLLARAGKKVVVLESDTLGSGATGATTAFLSQSIDTAFADLEGMYGASGARAIWRAGGDAIAEIQRIAADENIPCEMVSCPAHMYARDEREFEDLTNEAHAAVRMGFNVLLKHDDALHFPNDGYVEIPGQAKFHPLQFLIRLAAKAHSLGVRIYEGTPVIGLSEKGKVLVTTTHGASVHAQDAIVATYLPFNNPKPTHFKKGTYTSYVLEAHVKDCRIPEGIYWDLNRPYDYFRVDHWDDGDRIIVGGADHRSELPVHRKKCLQSLERCLKSILGTIPYKIIRTWDGPIIESSDGLPLIGAYAPHRYIATGFSGNGMTYAVVAAMLFRDRITGKENQWVSIFDPKRSLQPYRLWRKGIDYAREFFGGAFKNWFW